MLPFQHTRKDARLSLPVEVVALRGYGGSLLLPQAFGQRSHADVGPRTLAVAAHNLPHDYAKAGRVQHGSSMGAFTMKYRASSFRRCDDLVAKPRCSCISMRPVSKIGQHLRVFFPRREMGNSASVQKSKHNRQSVENMKASQGRRGCEVEQHLDARDY